MYDIINIVIIILPGHPPLPSSPPQCQTQTTLNEEVAVIVYLIHLIER